MIVKITKSIDIADKSPSIPIVKVVKGETRDDLSMHVAQRLIELECAVAVVKVKEPDKEPDNSGVSQENTGDDDVTPEALKAALENVALTEMDGPMGSEQKAKATLEEIGKRDHGFDVDKRKTIEGIIDAIVEAAFKAE